LYEGPSSFVSYLVSQQHNQSSLTNTTLILVGDASLDHVVSHLFQQVVEEVVTPMQYSANPTLLLESDQYLKVVEPTQSSADPTLISRSDVSLYHVFRLLILVPSE
jgi:hypothetical protein